MKKTVWLSGFILLSVAFLSISVLFGFADSFKSKKTAAGAKAKDNIPAVIIDPGHGGEDGGCSAADGTLEKDLNLSVSKYLSRLLSSMGVNNRMTREEDTMVYDMYSELSDYAGKKKIYDLKNRVKFAGESGALCFVSIHMNKFPQEKYKGFQVYYTKNTEGSLILADYIQNSVRNYLQKDNERLTKMAGSNIYVLHRASITSVLCECGFLSNREDTANIKDDLYKKKLSLCIAMGIAQWLYSGNLSEAS